MLHFDILKGFLKVQGKGKDKGILYTLYKDRLTVNTVELRQYNCLNIEMY